MQYEAKVNKLRTTIYSFDLLHRIALYILLIIVYVKVKYQMLLINMWV